MSFIREPALGLGSLCCVGEIGGRKGGVDGGTGRMDRGERTDLGTFRGRLRPGRLEPRKVVTLHLDEETWHSFRILCVKRNAAVNKEIDQLIRDQPQ